jgi:hypothetical protein
MSGVFEDDRVKIPVTESIVRKLGKLGENVKVLAPHRSGCAKKFAVESRNVMFWVWLPFTAMVMSVIVEEIRAVFRQSGWIVMSSECVAFITPTSGTVILAVRI